MCPFFSPEILVWRSEGVKCFCSCGRNFAHCLDVPNEKALFLCVLISVQLLVQKITFKIRQEITFKMRQDKTITFNIRQQIIKRLTAVNRTQMLPTKPSVCAGTEAPTSKLPLMSH